MTEVTATRWRVHCPTCALTVTRVGCWAEAIDWADAHARTAQHEDMARYYENGSPVPIVRFPRD